MTLRAITIIATSENGHPEAIISFAQNRKIVHGSDKAADAALDLIVKSQTKDQSQPKETK